jgi:hypothetical protein
MASMDNPPVALMDSSLDLRAVSPRPVMAQRAGPTRRLRG